MHKTHASIPTPPSMSDGHNNLGLVYAMKGLYNLAIEHHQKALDIILKAHETSPNHPSIAAGYNKLGLVYANKGLYDLAIEHYQKSLEIKLKAYASSPNHPDIAASYNNLGLVYADKGSYDLAVEYYKKALKIKFKAYTKEPNHPSIADSYNNLGNAYESKGEYDLAIEYHQKALKIFLKAYADTPNHPAIADSYNNLGNAYHALGLYDLAFEHHQEALNIRLEAYKTIPNHPSIAKSYGNLGNTCRACGLYDLAIEHCQKALEIRLKAYEDTPNHPDIADSRNNLGLVYFAKGLYDKAIGECSEALKIRLEAYEKINPNHPRIADSHNNLGLVYANKGLYDLAIKQYERALDIRLEAYKSSPNHPRIADSYNDLALVYIQKEEYDKALKYALESSNNTLIDIIYLQLGNNSFLSQDLENAQKYYEQIDSKLSTNLQECLSIIQFKYIDVIYEANLLSAAINCQKVLIKIDPELKYGNHYHNLACFSACQGNVEEANQAFIEGLNHKNAKTTAGLYVEYAQFLLLNKDNDILNINNDTITNYLYRAINCDNIVGLGYGKIEQNSVCDILQNLIKEKNSTIIIHPKILAYYLLITNPEYIKEDDDVETLLKSLDELCHTFYDSISLKILANAYSFSGYEVLSEKYSEYAKIMDKLEAIIANTALLESNREILKSDIVQELANNYYKLAYESLAKGFVGNSIKLFTKLFHIYEKKIIDNPESLQEIVNSIFTLSYIQNNIQQYIDLKVQYNAELDLRILKLLNLDTEQIQNCEKQLLSIDCSISGNLEETIE
ncbi:MAG TPA: tetratricopeptide repeat protein [Candidatus Megaira endosymbiont of Nemacystus decipiens]|nr:tetratricopeptide repeat protein [Candidatus Megaera endosymbiont of Nemacystus decipiens]